MAYPPPPTVERRRLGGPAPPAARGPLSAAVLDALSRGVGLVGSPIGSDVGRADPFGDDLQLALNVCYELHYQGFAGVDPGWEWDPELLRLRAEMERAFLAAVRANLPGGTDVAGTLDPLLVEPVDAAGVSHFLRDEGQWWHLREYFAHRSIYHLKEALVAVEFDEFGGGRGDRVHARLFADLLVGARLSPEYLHYLDLVPACTLATVNLMSLFGLHRSLRGALVGHFAAAEITTPPNAQRLDRALRRLDADRACRLFYTEHIEADAVHEQIMRRDVIGGLLADEPDLARDVVLGVQATEFLEDRFADHLLGAWHADRTSLRRPLFLA
jgi:heme oxygenase-like protein